jgi:DNA-binding MarR family transcriptional regulator
MEQHEIFRELIRGLERSLGVLDDTQSSCCSITMTQCHALVEIGRAKTVSLVDLSGTLGLDKSTISRTIDHLVNAKLVSRSTDQSNRRYITISLTEDGKKVFTDIETTMNLQFKRVLKKIPKEKQSAVMDSLKILIKAFQ